MPILDSIRDYNRRVLRQYKVGMNVEVTHHDSKDGPVLSYHWGTIAGFQFNCVGEICVVIETVAGDDEKPGRMVLSAYADHAMHSILILG